MATKTTTIRLPEALRQRLDRHLKQSRRSLNQLVAQAITEYLDRHTKSRTLLNVDETDIALLAEILYKEGRDE